MLAKKIEKRFEEMQKISQDIGFDPFDINFEMVSNDIMNEICSYGLPTRARHWSHGASYEHQRLYGEMGYSKVYEVILNNDPAYAFLLETNKEIDNTMVAAHVIGHSHYFKNNTMFKNTDRNMVYHAAERATRIESYIDEYGIDKVEKIMDVGFSLDRHIDIHKGLFRKKYDSAKIVKVNHNRAEYDDVCGVIKPSIEYKKIGYDIPPSPEKDFLWFFINYGKLENWEKDVLEIIREESYYFHPQYMTKISNEGLASYAHTEIMYRLDLSPDEMIDFACTHERVVQPGSNPYRINPYYLGLKILKDVEKKEGRDKMFEVCAEENDISLIRNYLSKDLVYELGLFSYGTKCEKIHKKGEKCNLCSFIEVKDKDLNQIVNNLIRPMLNYGVPELAITKINGDLMTIQHNAGELGTLDHKYAERTMELMFQLWAAPIEILTVDEEDKEIALSFDETGFSVLG
jgi:stage V sporulation protein R